MSKRDETNWREVRESQWRKHSLNEQNDVYDDANKAFEAGWDAAVKNDPRVLALVEALKKYQYRELDADYYPPIGDGRPNDFGHIEIHPDHGQMATAALKQWSES